MSKDAVYNGKFRIVAEREIEGWKRADGDYYIQLWTGFPTFDEKAGIAENVDNVPCFFVYKKRGDANGAVLGQRGVQELDKMKKKISAGKGHVAFCRDVGDSVRVDHLHPRSVSDIEAIKEQLKKLDDVNPYDGKLNVIVESGARIRDYYLQLWTGFPEFDHDRVHENHTLTYWKEGDVYRAVLGSIAADNIEAIKENLKLGKAHMAVCKDADDGKIRVENLTSSGNPLEILIMQAHAILPFE